MSYPTTEQPKSLPIESSQKAGIFEKLLVKQLSKLVVGHLHIQTPNNSYRLGQGGELGLVATLKVETMSSSGRRFWEVLWEWQTVTQMETGVHRTW